MENKFAPLLSRGKPGSRHRERNLYHAVEEQGALSEQAMIAKVLAMVGDEDDDRLIKEIEGLQFCRESSHTGVEMRDHAVVVGGVGQRRSSGGRTVRRGSAG